MSREVILVGGACDGLRFGTNAVDVLLMPTTLAAATGQAPSTKPCFSEYRESAIRNPRHPELIVFRYVGDGIDSDAAPAPRELEV